MYAGTTEFLLTLTGAPPLPAQSLERLDGGEVGEKETFIKTKRTKQEQQQQQRIQPSCLLF
jgi:hypothetical protein